MKKKRIRSRKKGSALILVLISTLLIISLCIIALSVSLNNVKMASKVQKTSSEYYFMEKVAQDILSDIDVQLKFAENSARSYMEKELFKKDYRDVKDEPEVKGLKQELNHDMIHNMWLELVKNPSSVDQNGGVNSALYSQLFDNFFEEAYNRLYFSYCQKTDFILREETEKNSEGIYSDKYYEVHYKIKPNNGEKEKNYDSFTWDNSSDADNLTKWIKYRLNPNDFTFNIDMFGCNENGKAQLCAEGTLSKEEILKYDARKIQGIMSIQPPKYEAIESKRYKSSRLNPVYTNAITSNGNINFGSGTHYVDGEVIAMNPSSSINFNGATSTIRGNLSSANSINVLSNSKVYVNMYNSTGVDLTLKKKIYNDEDVFYDISQDEIMTIGITDATYGRVIENSTNPFYSDNKKTKQCMPILFKDIMGGNTYCNSLNIENGTKNTVFDTRNIMFDSGIYIKNCTESEINISNVAMTTSNNSVIKQGDTEITDYTNVSNVSPNELNKIKIGSGYIGDVFVDHTGVYHENTTKYCVGRYRFVDIDTAKGTYTRTPLPSILSSRTTHLGTVSRGFGNLVNISLLEGPEKIPVFNLGDTAKWQELNMLKYIANDSSENVIDLNGKVLKGIFYCKGNLTIKNSSSTAGEIQGAIICSGDVNIQGNVNIVYSESVIRETLKVSKATREFFVPGEMGAAYNLQVESPTTNVDDYSNSKARMKTSNERYIITKWARSRVK